MRQQTRLRSRSFHETQRYLRELWKPLHRLHLPRISRKDVAARLESSLRFFLLKANNETFSSPKATDTDAPLNYITKFISLGDLIKEYNEELEQSESAAFGIDNESLRIRDALAHGRLVAPTKEYPLTLWKFGREVSDRVPIEFNEVLTAEWLEKAWKMIDRQRIRVDACSKQREYPIT